MFIPDAAATALTSPATQQTTQRSEQVSVQNAGVSSQSKVSVEVAPTAVKASGQAETPSDRAKGDNPDTSEEVVRARLEQVAAQSLGSETGKLSVAFDDKAERFVYQTRDSETGEVVRQYPSEEILGQISKQREVRGLVVEETA